MSEAYHKEQIWIFGVYEKDAQGNTKPWPNQNTKAKAKTLESALKQCHSRFPEDKYMLKYIKTEPIVSESRKEIATIINRRRGSIATHD